MNAPTPADQALLKALCALAVRHGRLRSGPLGVIAGNIQRAGQDIGLLNGEAEVMARLSRRLLMAGREDIGAEIFSLLGACTRALGEWLPDVEDFGPEAAAMVLLDAQTGLATEEAVAMSVGFAGLDAELQQGAFALIRVELDNRHPELAARDYTRLREFVLRHPVGERGEISARIGELRLPSPLVAILFRDIYEPAPRTWSDTAGMPVCAHCGNALVPLESQGLGCRSRSCRFGHPTAAATPLAGEQFICVTPAFQLYWVEPGVDELRLYDALRAMGKEPALYPDRDRVDIAFGEVGVDLKNYASPIMLGKKLASGLGGLSRYRHKWLVVPDRFVKPGDPYREQLAQALGENARRVEILGVTEAIARAAHA